MMNVIGPSYPFGAITDPNRLAYGPMQLGLPHGFGFAPDYGPWLYPNFPSGIGIGKKCS
jgi:hypothetical protein